MRHEIEERQSKANRREEEGNARDGDDVRIDLESGVAVIDPAAAQAREQALEQLRAEKERREAAARRKAQRRAAAQASSGSLDSTDSTDSAEPTSDPDTADEVVGSTPVTSEVETQSRPGAAPRTKAHRNR